MTYCTWVACLLVFMYLQSLCFTQGGHDLPVNPVTGVDGEFQGWFHHPLALQVTDEHPDPIQICPLAVEGRVPAILVLVAQHELPGQARRVKAPLPFEMYDELRAGPS